MNRACMSGPFENGDQSVIVRNVDRDGHGQPNDSLWIGSKLLVDADQNGVERNIVAAGEHFKGRADTRPESRPDEIGGRKRRPATTKLWRDVSMHHCSSLVVSDLGLSGAKRPTGGGTHIHDFTGPSAFRYLFLAGKVGVAIY